VGEVAKIAWSFEFMNNPGTNDSCPGAQARAGTIESRQCGAAARSLFPEPAGVVRRLRGYRRGKSTQVFNKLGYKQYAFGNLL